MQRTLLVSFIIVAAFQFQEVFAENLLVFDVKKNLKLKDSDPQYKDLYINGGEEYGLRPGMLVTVYRKVSMYDTLRNKSAGDVKIYVGRVKIIHVQNGLSVGRTHSQLSRRKLPIVDYESIMVGDRLDMDTAEMDRGKPKKRALKPARKSKPVATQEPKLDGEVERVSLSSKLPQKSVQIPNMK